MTTIFVALPRGDGYGWGILGDNLALALARFASVWRVTSRASITLPGPLIESVGGNLRPHYGELSAQYRIAYVVFENDITVQKYAAAALKQFDTVVTACRWCENALKQGGLSNTTTILHGIDPRRFNPGRGQRRRFRNEFTVFSGGKFEFRKGHDVVVKAFKAFAERHTDARLVAAWHNPVPPTHLSMTASPYWPFVPIDGRPFSESVLRWLSGTGIDMDRVTIAPPLPNRSLAQLYLDSDVGLFPNRCEGATNLVLMEYMACGRAAICTDFSGHTDIISNENSIPLRSSRAYYTTDVDGTAGCWCEPDIDEIVEALEKAYRERDIVTRLGQQAALDMAELTWHRAAQGFIQVLPAALT